MVLRSHSYRIFVSYISFWHYRKKVGRYLVPIRDQRLWAIVRAVVKRNRGDIFPTNQNGSWQMEFHVIQDGRWTIITWLVYWISSSIRVCLYHMKDNYRRHWREQPCSRIWWRECWGPVLWWDKLSRRLLSYNAISSITHVTKSLQVQKQHNLDENAYS